MKKLLLGLVFVIPMTAQSITVNIDGVSCGSIPQLQCDQLTEDLRNEANKDTPDVSIDKYADGISNSVSFAAQGQGSEYADDFSIFTVKATGATAVQGVDFSDASKIQDEIAGADGVGVGASLSVGINLDILPINKIGPLDLSKMDLFMSFMSYNVDEKFGDTGVKGDLASFGVHARYRLFESVSFVPFDVLKWGGVQLHAGFIKNSMKIDMTQSLNDVEGNAGGATATFENASVDFTIDSNAMTIPLEVSTSFTFGYVLSLYTGIGADIVSGSTDIDLTASGDINGSGGYNADLQASESGSGEANVFNQRAFLGAQFNLPVLKIYTHVNKALGQDLLSVGVGAKISW